jgi:hypothetical protein
LLALGGRSFSIAAGHTASVSVTLSASGFRLLVRLTRLSAHAQIHYKQPAGGTTMATRAITLEAPANQ